MTQLSDPIGAKREEQDALARRTTFEGRQRHCDASAEGTLQRTLRAPSEARAFVDEQLCPEHGHYAVAAVRLVASEVVLHAVRSGDGPVTIALECDVTSVTLRVTCAMDAPVDGARLQLGDPVSSMIVDSICRASGAMHTQPGLMMWCTLPTGQMPSAYPDPAGPQGWAAGGGET